ncbi:MAG: putative toxin-antitoxin system toxin component, PIN family [Gemmatimonadales bacterium]|nr:putative toxin-antitoxin system toxin component, PIN family [Gemmatimonadales bacterium]
MVSHVIPHGPHVILDTNVLVAGLRSRRGASFALLESLAEDAFEISVSVPLFLEYEAVARRQARELGLTHADVDAVVDLICAKAHHRQIFYLWRPFLRDPKDDMVLEVAVEAGCRTIVTFTVRGFAGVEQFGIEAVTPPRFLARLQEAR